MALPRPGVAHKGINMGTMNEGAQDEFLAKTRLGILTMLRIDGSPSSVPVWFDWDGHTVRIFTESTAPKVKRITHDPRVSLLITNDVDEPETWIAFDGPASISKDGGFELAERLAAKFWDLSDPERKETLESWRATADDFYLIEFVPDRIRSYSL